MRSSLIVWRLVVMASACGTEEIVPETFSDLRIVYSLDIAMTSSKNQGKMYLTPFFTFFFQHSASKLPG